MSIPPTIKRTISRLAAVQAIYAHDIRSQDVSKFKLITDFINYYNKNEKDPDQNDKLASDSSSPTPDEKYLAELITKSIENRDEIEQLIAKYLTNDWSLDHLSGMLKAILRAGISEFKYFRTPTKVVINEYTNLARQFYSQSEVGFVNGILEKISIELRT